MPALDAVASPDDRVTFADLSTQSEHIARALAARGIGPGDRVGLAMGNGPAWVAAFFALARLGAVTVPVNTRLAAPEIAFALGHTGARALILAPRVQSADLAAMLPAIRDGAPDLREAILTAGDAPDATPWDALMRGDTILPPPPGPDDDLVIQFTSGTTAQPKGVPLTHAQMLRNGFVSGLRLGLRAGDRLHAARPFFHVAGTTLSILSCLQHRAALVTAERFDPAATLDQLAEERCTHIAANDTLATMLLGERPDPARLHLRGAWLAATPATTARGDGRARRDRGGHRLRPLGSLT